MSQVFLRYISKSVYILITLFLLTSCDAKVKTLVSQESRYAENQTAEIKCVYDEGQSYYKNSDETMHIDETDIVLEYLLNHCIALQEPENRNFDISYPIEVEGENCYKIIMLGKLIDGSAYLIDTFAINIDNYTPGLYVSCKCYYYDNNTSQFEILQGGIKLYSSITSPNGRYRLENAEIINGSTSGGFAKLRVIDLTTGEFSEVADGIDYTNNRVWSEDSRFITFEHQWIWYSDIVIVDMLDFSRTTLVSNKISDILFNDEKYAIDPGDEHYYIIDKWVDGSILQVKFHCFTNRGEFHGEFQYDAITKTIKNIVIEE